MSSHQSNTLLNSDSFEKKHDDSLNLEGLDHIFRWASEVVADGEDTRVRMAREKRIKRQVLETVQKAREQKVLADATTEIAYLQRRVIALLAKIQEVIEENSTLKQMMVSQYYALQQVAALEYELKELRNNQIEKDAAITERRYLMDGLAKMKVERDYLEELLTATEADNARLGSILRDTRAQLEELQAKRWWHYFIPKSFRAVNPFCQ
ncbi:MAG: hypothetical protein C5B53_08170 [Candidatus Melainabacteria bacterium]|nr:MAG: hypothetical protein C5B53_08170 [Candidatus Melainabacteria bacterium]